MKTVFLLARHSFKELVRKKDFYVLLFLLIGLIIFFYNKTFFGTADASRYLKDIGYSLVMICSIILCVTFTAKQIPSELESKTIYPLLAKPVSRDQLVWGKFLGGLFMSAASFTIFFIVYLIFINLKGEGVKGILMFQAYIFSLCLFTLLSAVTVFFSMFLTLSANITLTLLLFFYFSWYNESLRSLLLDETLKMRLFYNLLFYALPHFEFFDMKTRLAHSWDPIPLWIFVSVIAYTLIYSTLLVISSSALFRRKNL